jgi:hypothetical protein
VSGTVSNLGAITTRLPAHLWSTAGFGLKTGRTAPPAASFAPTFDTVPGTSNFVLTDSGHVESQRLLASSGEISSMRNLRPRTRPIIDTCSNWVRDSGPVTTYSAPACSSSHKARTARAAISRSSIGLSERRGPASARRRRHESAAPTSAEHLRRAFRAAETST